MTEQFILWGFLHHKTTSSIMGSTLWLWSLVALLCLAPLQLHSQSRMSDTDPRERPIPQPPRKKKPIESIEKDTVQKILQNDADSLPGIGNGYRFTARQDTFYFREMRLKIPSRVRFSLMAKPIISTFDLLKKEPETAWQMALQTMQIPDRYYIPDAREVTQRDVMIRNSQYIPGFYRPAQMAGVNMSLNSIGQFFGVVEDVSPTLQYRVDSTSSLVTVVVYNTAAMIIATLHKKVQANGSYSITWNGLDDKGKQMPSGDYVIEARTNAGIFRKRVVWE